MSNHRPNTSTLLPLAEYDRIIVSYSGGKDSLACLLRLLGEGADPSRIELWHQDVDGGQANGLMDWPCTHGYVRATGQALGLPVRFQWKQGGFEGEMLRENARTRPSTFQLADGSFREAGGCGGQRSIRRRFPQVSADLSVRWCSAYLKIDVAALALNNDPDLADKQILFVTGERRQESTARSQYPEVERHRCSRHRRRVDHWRAVIAWEEADVWRMIRRCRIRPHPAYYLGWGRVSCLLCIFGDADQWASARALVPDQFNRVAGYEQDFGVTIRKGLTVVDQADRGTPFPQLVLEKYRRLALSHDYPSSAFFLTDGEEWEQPAGAYKRCGDPV